MSKNAESGEGHKQALLDCLSKQLKAKGVERSWYNLEEAIRSPHTNFDIISKGMSLDAKLNLEIVFNPDSESPYVHRLGSWDLSALSTLEIGSSSQNGTGSDLSHQAPAASCESSVVNTNEHKGVPLTINTQNRKEHRSTPTIVNNTGNTNEHTRVVMLGKLGSHSSRPSSATKDGSDTMDHKTSGEARSKLKEYCDKKKWPNPIFKCQDEHGPSHIKQFRYSVSIMISEENRLDFHGDTMPRVKEAQDSAAHIALQWLECNHG